MNRVIDDQVYQWLFLYFPLLFLMSLFLSWNRDFSKDREFGREASSVGDVSSIKSKTVCTFYCLNFHPSLCGLLCAFYFLWVFYQKFTQKLQACRRTLIALYNPSNYFAPLIILVYGNCLFWLLLLIKRIVYQAIFWLIMKWLRGRCPFVSPLIYGQQHQPV